MKTCCPACELDLGLRLLVGGGSGQWAAQPTQQAFQVKVVERTVEGRHSRIHNVFKRAPHASPPYISMELRFSELEDVMVQNPQEIATLAAEHNKLCSFKGLRDAVVKTIMGGAAADRAVVNTERDLSKMLCREHLRQQFANQSDLRQEIAKKRKQMEPEPLQPPKLRPDMRMLLDHFREALRRYADAHV